MSRKPSPKSNLEKCLLVEGKDDAHVCMSLFKHYNIPDSFSIIDGEGVTNILDKIELEVDKPDLLVMGLVLDADTHIAARWQSLRARLITHYPNFPVSPEPQGTIVEEIDQPKLGIWIMPNNTLPGMLEDFVAYLVPDPATDELWQLSEKCLQEARSLNPAIPVAKGRIHTYLAWQAEPGTPLGLSITKKYLNPAKPEAKNFIDWITRLFS